MRIAPASSAWCNSPFASRDRRMVCDDNVGFQDHVRVELVLLREVGAHRRDVRSRLDPLGADERLGGTVSS